MAKKAATDTDETAALIEVPLLKTDGYVPRLLEVRLANEQAETLKQIANGLTRQGARIADGHMVRDSATAIQWMLEQAAK
jgi:aminoglycoside/choline kinase family phosphotransferase